MSFSVTFFRAAAVMLALSLVGCISSKWAMDDPDYATKYGKPYGDDKIPRMAKQIVDARHVTNKSGAYVGAAFQDHPLAVGGEFGVFTYPVSWLSVRAGLAGLAGTDADDVFTGVNLGARIQSPSRLAPFVGLGVFGGYSKEEVTAPCGCREEEIDGGFVAVYPEVGVHFWLNSRWRLTGSSSYFVTAAGRDQDFWFTGMSLALLFN